jgi:hypothetical protein
MVFDWFCLLGMCENAGRGAPREIPPDGFRDYDRSKLARLPRPDAWPVTIGAMDSSGVIKRAHHSDLAHFC